MKVTSKTKMDLLHRSVTPHIYAVQGDRETRALEISLYAAGVAWPVPEGATIAVRYRKYDGTAGYYDTLPDGTTAWTASGNVVTVTLAPQMLTAAGPVVAQLELMHGTSVLASFAFYIDVEANPAAGELTSEDYTNWLQWMENELDQRMTQAKESGDFDGPTGPRGTAIFLTDEFLHPDNASSHQADISLIETCGLDLMVGDILLGKYGYFFKITSLKASGGAGYVSVDCMTPIYVEGGPYGNTVYCLSDYFKLSEDDKVNASINIDVSDIQDFTGYLKQGDLLRTSDGCFLEVLNFSSRSCTARYIGSLLNDTCFYTKTEIDALFANLRAELGL